MSLMESELEESECNDFHFSPITLMTPMLSRFLELQPEVGWAIRWLMTLTIQFSLYIIADRVISCINIFLPNLLV